MLNGLFMRFRCWPQTGLGLKWPCGKVDIVSPWRKQTGCCKENWLLLCPSCGDCAETACFAVFNKCSNTHRRTRTAFPVVEDWSLTLQGSNFLLALHQHVLLYILLPPKNAGARIEVMLLAWHVRNHLFLVSGRVSLRYKQDLKIFTTLQWFWAKCYWWGNGSLDYILMAAFEYCARVGTVNDVIHITALE